MSDDKTSTAVLVGFGAVGFCGLAMWWLAKASDADHYHAYGISPAFRGVPSTQRSPVSDEMEAQTERTPMSSLWAQTERTPMPPMSVPYSSGVRTMRSLLREPNPPTTLRRRS